MGLHYILNPPRRTPCVFNHGEVLIILSPTSGKIVDYHFHSHNIYTVLVNYCQE